jgi:hypothetical protein
VRKFPELHRTEFERFLVAFTKPGSLKFRNKKWIGLTREGKPFTIRVKHGVTKKYPSQIVEAIAKDLSVKPEEFWGWYECRPYLPQMCKEAQRLSGYSPFDRLSFRRFACFAVPFAGRRFKVNDCDWKEAAGYDCDDDYARKNTCDSHGPHRKVSF